MTCSYFEKHIFLPILLAKLAINFLLSRKINFSLIENFNFLNCVTFKVKKRYVEHKTITINYKL